MKIIILGGGTAGWIAALSIVKSQPGLHDVTVIESKKVGIIGAGEGSTGIFTDFIAGTFFPTGIDISDFIDFLVNTILILSFNGLQLFGNDI